MAPSWQKPTPCPNPHPVSAVVSPSSITSNRSLGRLNASRAEAALVGFAAWTNCQSSHAERWICRSQCACAPSAQAASCAGSRCGEASCQTASELRVMPPQFEWNVAGMARPSRSVSTKCLEARHPLRMVSLTVETPSNTWQCTWSQTS